jgi:hypothetical protein
MSQFTLDSTEGKYRAAAARISTDQVHDDQTRRDREADPRQPNTPRNTPRSQSGSATTKHAAPPALTTRKLPRLVLPHIQLHLRPHRVETVLEPLLDDHPVEETGEEDLVVLRRVRVVGAGGPGDEGVELAEHEPGVGVSGWQGGGRVIGSMPYDAMRGNGTRPL